MNGKQRGMARLPQQRVPPGGDAKLAARVSVGLMRAVRGAAVAQGVTIQEFVRDAVQTALRRRHGQESR